MPRHTVMLINPDSPLDISIFGDLLETRGIKVDCPQSQEGLTGKLLAEGRVKSDRPSMILVLYYTPEQLVWFLPLLRQAESSGIRVVNSTSLLALFNDYPQRSRTLQHLGLPVPYFFYGCSSEIPTALGEMVVWKSLTSRQTILCPRTGIHSLDQPVYVEAQIENPGKRVLTIYSIAGCRYARWKEDPLQTKKRTRELVANLAPFARELAAVEAIADSFNLVFFNAEFIEGKLVDVNTIANFFYRDHLDPLNALADWIARQLKL